MLRHGIYASRDPDLRLSGKPVRHEDRGDRLSIPSEDQLLHWSSRADAARSEHSHAFPSFATDAVVRDSIGMAASQLDSQFLRGRIISRRVDVREITLSIAQIENMRAFDRRLQNLEIQVLGRCQRRV